MFGNTRNDDYHRSDEMDLYPMINHKILDGTFIKNSAHLLALSNDWGMNFSSQGIEFTNSYLVSDKGNDDYYMVVVDSGNSLENLLVDFTQRESRMMHNGIHQPVYLFHTKSVNGIKGSLKLRASGYNIPRWKLQLTPWPVHLDSENFDINAEMPSYDDKRHTLILVGPFKHVYQ